MNNNNGKTESSGAIWKGVTRSGLEKLSIKVTIEGKDYNLVALPNTFKTAENQPDYRVFISQTNQSDASKQAPVAKQAPIAAPQLEDDDVDTSDDIPF